MPNGRRTRSRRRRRRIAHPHAPAGDLEAWVLDSHLVAAGRELGKPKRSLEIGGTDKRPARRALDRYSGPGDNAAALIDNRTRDAPKRGAGQSGQQERHQHAVNHTRLF